MSGIIDGHYFEGERPKPPRKWMTVETREEMIALAAKRAARWLAKNTVLSPEEIVACEHAIRDLAGPTTDEAGE